MPANKNALIRYRFLDELLSSRVSYYTREELWNKVNERLASPVSKRCIEMDLIDIQDEWGIDYDEIKDEYGKRRIHYADKSFSIFNKELTEEERTLLKSALDTLGQFDGLPNFEWLEAMRLKLSKGGRSAMSAGEFENDGNKIIEFGSNHYLKNSNMIAGLFQHIASKQVIHIEYLPYLVESSIVETVSPYRLKQYNNRWYLLCCRMSDGRFSNYALDRLVSYEKVDGIEYMPCPIEIDEHFDDIVGVTYFKDEPIQTVLFAGNPKDIQYILTKPIHWSQKNLNEQKQAELHRKYPNVPINWVFLTVECRWNFELITTLFSYGERIVVLSPEKVVSDLKKKIMAMQTLYQEL
ncbi:MAG: WYL domain-containing protein [Bacteroidales bacterium]|nr:WYL domain-containing protein [Bacteroidales bacterium]